MMRFSRWAFLLLIIALVAHVRAQEAESCTVRTDSDTTQVHLGPGFNRAVAAFLPLNQPVEVIGQFGGEDGLWYQVDKAQVAPASSAAQLWVFEGTVEISGDCSAISDSAPAPLNALPNAPVQDGQPLPALTPVPARGILPAIGLWTLTMQATMTRTCEGVEGVVTVNTAEVYRGRQRTERLTIGPGNNNITYRFDILTRPDGTNVYMGDVSYEDVIGAYMTLEMGSETFMFGKIDVAYTVDGFNCVGSIPVIVEYNFPQIPGERGTIILPTPLAP